MSDKPLNRLNIIPCYDKDYNCAIEVRSEATGEFVRWDEVKALEKQLEGCLAKCRDDANNLLMGISTPISPDDFDKLINDMRQIGK